MALGAEPQWPRAGGGDSEGAVVGTPPQPRGLRPAIALPPPTIPPSCLPPP